jgi:hypothetical protein
MTVDTLSPRGISPFGLAVTYGQLQDLIQEAIERVTAPLQARLDALEEKRGVGCRVGGETHRMARKA